MDIDRDPGSRVDVDRDPVAKTEVDRDPYIILGTIAIQTTGVGGKKR